MAVLLLAMACVTACAMPAGGGAAGGNAGGAEGSSCNPATQVEGCYGQQRMACTAGTWQPLGTCSPSETCSQTPAAVGFSTSCKTLAVQPGADATSGADTTTTTGPDATSVGNDVFTTPADVAVSTGPSSPMMKCAMQKCASIWAICVTDNPCMASAMCMDKCGNDAGCQYSCISDASGPAASTLSSLAQCAQAAGCATPNPQCGNGKCDSGETKASCPSDCGSTSPYCGNGTCESGETKASCPSDCGSTSPYCGNGTCDSGETKASCPSDCGSTSPYCGNGTCDSGETKTSCPSDCGSTIPYCGNGKCESGETAGNCASDCGGVDPTTCMQQKCASQISACQSNSGCSAILTCLQNCQDQNCANSCLSKANSQAQSLFMAANDCAAQCSSTSTPKCGDGQCNGTETKTSCPTDCGSAGYCGDGQCSGGETAATCASDCGGGPDTCGDGTCQAGESATNCAVDCDPTTKCVVQACGSELDACGNNASCPGVYTCFKNCGTDQKCANACYTNAPAATQTIVANLEDCKSSSGCFPG